MDLSKIQRALGILEGLTWSLESGMAQAVENAIAMIDEELEKYEPD